MYLLLTLPRMEERTKEFMEAIEQMDYIFTKSKELIEKMWQIAQKLETMKKSELQDYIIEQSEAEKILSTL